jgi:hypothetical protein
MNQLCRDEDPTSAELRSREFSALGEHLDLALAALEQRCRLLGVDDSRQRRSGEGGREHCAQSRIDR